MSEYTVVQKPLIGYAEAVGWQYVGRDEALKLRAGETGRLFTDTLTAQLLKLNPAVVNHERADEIARRLRLLPATMEGNRDALAWLRGEQSVFDPHARRERNVRLVDFAHPEANVFQITDEWVQGGVAFRNRADVVFLINGIPVAVAETKAATHTNGIAEGVEQVRRYHRETPDLLALPQLFEVTHLWDFYYGATWSLARKALFNWKDERPGEQDFESKVTAFFDRARFLGVLRDYIVFLTTDDQLTKIVLRQHQTRAVERVLDRVADPKKRRGLVWHTQGSGKTYTMLTIASRLLRDGAGEKPTVLMLVDRNELEAQLFRHVQAYGIADVRVANSKRELQDLLAHDTRGLIVSMIHKFDDVPADLNTRTGITVLVDEAHRTTGGDLGNYLLAALPNATYIGFTGTPIQRISRGEGTFKVFGSDDAPQGYLDKYSIRESVVDGTTVELNYALASSALRVDKETLEREFLSLARAEGLSDIEELNAVLDRAVELKEAMKSPDRVDKIAQMVAAHYRENVEPMGFKAFLVAVDRQACALYKQALDRYLPPEYSQVIISQAHNDGPELKAHYLSEEAEKDIRKRFAREKDATPKILIVTEKLLTGFDAPILYAMYLDKPMRDHVLLQAIARVNRPYEDASGQTKPYGFVLDFVGIFENLERALAFDSDVVESVIHNLDALRHLFAAQMATDAQPYLAYTRGGNDKAKEQAVAHFERKEEREAFFTFFKRVQNLYDILSPDAFLRPYMDEYQALAELFALVQAAYADSPYVDRELTAKTRALLRDKVTSADLALPGAIHTLGAEELAMLRASNHDDTTKVLNLRKILMETVRKDAQTKPYAQTIGERAEELMARYEERHETTQAVLHAFEQLAMEYVEADAERERLGLDANTFAVFKEVQRAAPGITTAQAREMDALFVALPDYRWNDEQARQLRTKLYGKVRPLVGATGMIAVTNALLKLPRA